MNVHDFQSEAGSGAARCLVGAMLLLVVGSIGCGTAQCTYSQQCAGNILQTCHDPQGLTDQRYETQDCTQQGMLCVQTAPNVASCAPPPCDSTYLNNCQGTVLFYCYNGGVTGVDCATATPSADADGICVDSGNGNAQCQVPPY